MRSRQNSPVTKTIRDESFISFNYKKLSRLSHDELMIPLIYWSSCPQHNITAICVHKSLRFGEILITGSNKGEFVVWRSISTILNFNDEEKEDTHFQNEIDKHTKWIAMSMTYSTNTTSIRRIIGLTSYHDELAFTAIHNDGELVIFSISGSGALKICRSERPIIYDSAIGNIFGFEIINDLYKYILCTNYNNDCIHLIDLNKGRQIKQFSLSESLDDLLENEHDFDCNLAKVVDLTFLNDNKTFICIDIDRKMGIFKIEPQLQFKSIQSMDFRSRLRNKPIAIDSTFDNQYVVAISYNEFAVYSIKPSLSRITSKTERNVNWNGMLIFDKYINYKMLPDYEEEGENNNNPITTTAPTTDVWVVRNPFSYSYGSIMHQILHYISFPKKPHAF